MKGSASLFDEGRFRPVHRSYDPETDQPVMVRTFDGPLGADEQGRLVEALTGLCNTPLDHPSIARPLAAGVQDGRPYLVHTILPGVPLPEFLAQHGPQPFSDVILRVTQLAAAIDFAAAAGVHHGDLQAKDVMVAPESTGIVGFGLVQALQQAGIGKEVRTVTRADDVYALGEIAFELLCGRLPDGLNDARIVTARGANTALLREAFTAALGRDPEARPATALEFAAALQRATAEVEPAPEASAVAAVEPAVSEPEVAAPVHDMEALDLPLWEGEARDVRLADDRDEPAIQLAGPVTPLASGPPPGPQSDPGERAAPRAVPPASPMFAGAAPERPAAHESSGTGWFLVTAALAIGLLAGFAAGFVAGQRGMQVPLPATAAEAIRPAPPPAVSSGPVVVTEEPIIPEPSPTAGTEAASGVAVAPGDDTAAPAPATTPGPVAQAPPPVAPASAQPAGGGAAAPSPPAGQTPPATASASPATGTPSTPPPASTAPAPTAAPSTPATAPAAARASGPPPVAPNTPGAMQVLSRPEGAQVFLDGVLVGQTPLLIADVRPGLHTVRIELAGYRQWATSVRVAPGERARVAASLGQ